MKINKYRLYLNKNRLLLCFRFAIVKTSCEANRKTMKSRSGCNRNLTKVTQTKKGAP